MLTPNHELRVGQLHNVGGIVKELGRLYRSARKGEVDASDASKFAQILNIMRQCVEASDIEKRLKVLEADQRVV